MKINKVHSDPYMSSIDRISELPDPMLHLILTCLHSTEEAVRTSVLSTRWRYLWTSLSIIDIGVSRGSKPLKAFDKDKLKEFVYWILANRTLGLDSFTLHCRKSCLDYYDMSTIERWIHIALMRKAKQIVLPPCLVDNLDSHQIYVVKHQYMKNSNQPKAQINDNNIDRFSNLPDRILHMILSRLKSTEEVVRTSVLSSRWRYLWTSIPSLDFHVHRGKSRSSVTTIGKIKFKEFVYWVLANRILDLDSFSLNCWGYCDMSTIGRWIYLLVMRKIKQLDLEFSIWDNDGVVVLPCCLVNCDSLEVLKLKLNWSSLSLSNFTGSRTLKVLELESVRLLDHELLRKFLVNCPMLEELSLRPCLTNYLDYLSISCPNLKTLRIEHLSCCKRLMVSCPKLMYLEYGGLLANQLQFDVKSLKKAVIKHGYIEQKDEIVVIRKLFAQISHVEYLSVNYFFVKGGYLPESLPNLKTLELTIDCYIMKLLSTILKYFPNLESLHLVIRMDTAPGNYEAFAEELNEVETRRILTRHLKTVKFLELYYTKEYLATARFFLEHGNALEEMVFSWYNSDKGLKKSVEDMNEVSKFYKASRSVKVITLVTNFYHRFK